MASSVKKIIHKNFVKPISDFIKDSRAIGITLLACTIVSLILSNTTLVIGYISFWETSFHLPGFVQLPHTLLHYINDLLMAFFFFMAGMEIKKELLTGELSSFRKAALPVAAAIGGMLVPAFIYFHLNKGTAYANGWGIPMATDIAFSLGVASLLGKRVPISLKIFLMALAIIDDLGAILVIALFYGGEIKSIYLLFGIVICVITGLLNYFRKTNVFLLVLLGLLLWYCIFNSGIHATIAGVLMAFFVPVGKLDGFIHKLHIPVNFIILPIFALANTAILIPANFADNITTSLSWGVMLGLLIGKPVGILILCWLTVRLKLGQLPAQTSWTQMIGIGLLAAIGFTMSIFITMLAFKEPAYCDISKIAVLIASLVAILTGFTVLYFADTKSEKKSTEAKRVFQHR